VVYELRGGRLVDVSGRPQYRTYFMEKLPQYRTACEQSRSNGVCAGYLAVAARAGMFQAALPVFRRSLPTEGQEEAWSVPQHCASTMGMPGCEHEKPDKTFATFEGAVDWFLRDIGYLPGAASRGGEP
jgi:hypothetical protein